MPATKIMLIRHAEKPLDDTYGVASQGRRDDDDLSVLGWQRAGALAVLLAPPGGRFTDTRLATPSAIFGAGGGREGHTRRSHSTVIPLARKLGLREDASCYKGQEQKVADAAQATDGVVLIAWEHKLLPQVGHAIMGDTTTCPSDWPHERFDVIWVFDRTATGWRFDQVPQRLLAGDLPEVIAHG